MTDNPLDNIEDKYGGIKTLDINVTIQNPENPEDVDFGVYGNAHTLCREIYLQLYLMPHLEHNLRVDDFITSLKNVIVNHINKFGSVTEHDDEDEPS